MSRLSIIHMNVNGKFVEVAYDERESLLDTLRNRLDLTSVKKGCEVGECGACSVLLEGHCVDACIYLTKWAEGKTIITTEGLQDENGDLTDVQKQFIKETAVQCGFCIPGFILKAVEIVGENKPYTRDEIRKKIAGNLCRCTGYMNIVTAIEHAIYNNLKKQGIEYKLDKSYLTYLEDSEEEKNKKTEELLLNQETKNATIVKVLAKDVETKSKIKIEDYKKIH